MRNDKECVWKLKVGPWNRIRSSNKVQLQAIHTLFLFLLPGSFQLKIYKHQELECQQQIKQTFNRNHIYQPGPRPRFPRPVVDESTWKLPKSYDTWSAPVPSCVKVRNPGDHGDLLKKDLIKDMLILMGMWFVRFKYHDKQKECFTLMISDNWL